MAIDATGTPTSLGIPKYNTATDPPSGKGFNAAMDALDVLIAGRIAKTLTTTTGDIIYASSANTPARLGIGSTGQVLTVAGGVPSWAASTGSGQELAYVEFTSPVSVSAGVTIATTASVSYDGSTAIIVEIFAPQVRTEADNGTLLLSLLENGSQIGRIGQVNVSGANGGGPGLMRRRLTPTAGDKTYGFYAEQLTGTHKVNVGVGGAGVWMPGYIRITKV